MAELPARFLKRISIDATTGCWLWTGVLHRRDGYGLIGKHGQRAHRMVFGWARGYLPPSLDHLCRVRRCVNPDHLEDVDIGTNVLRGENPCAKNARKTLCKRGHPFAGENLRLLHARKRHRDGKERRCRECSRMHLRNFRIRQRRKAGVA